MPPIPQRPTPGADDPDVLRPFQWLGIDLAYRRGAKDATGDCPVCGGEGKFAVNVETGQWHCVKNCADSLGRWAGNLDSLPELVWNRSEPHPKDIEELATAKGLLYLDTLERWGLRRSLITGDAILPTYGKEGTVINLFKWTWNADTQRYCWMGMPHPRKGAGFFGVASEVADLIAGKLHAVHVCEGPWDGMAWWEAYGRLHKVGVIAVPTASIFYDSWAPVFAGKVVSLLYDNDHRRKHPLTKAVIEPAGFEGMKRAAGILKGLPEGGRPKQIKYLHWGMDGFDPNLPHGYDLRDHVSQADEQKERTSHAKGLLERLLDVPGEWPVIKLGKAQPTPLACDSWPTLLTAWKEAMRWSYGLEKSLATCLACVASTKTIGEQVWVMLLSPPSTGKTTLVEGLTIAKEYVYAKDTYTGLFSGYKTDKQGNEDHSMLPKIIDKTFIIKDGDTLRTSTDKERLLGELRAAYDGCSRNFFRHGVDRDYEHYRFTSIICGTGAMRELDAAELGARYITCAIMEEIEEEDERSINEGVIARVERNAGIEANGSADTLKDARTIRAQRLTGGYVKYLREHGSELASRVRFTDAARTMIPACGEFVAFMRARESKKQTEVAERENSARLVEQYARLAIYLAVVFQSSEIDDRVVRTVRQLAMDSSRGTTLNLVRWIHGQSAELGVNAQEIQYMLGARESETNKILQFLRKIRVVEPFEAESRYWAGKRIQWRLTPRVARLYEQVAGVEVPYNTPIIEE